MTGSASDSAAPWMALSPMPPTPITTTDWPWATFARLNTAPTPVSTPQPMSDAEVSGTSSGIFTAWVALTTVSSQKTPRLANWNTFCGSSGSPLVNGRDSLPSDWRQKVGLPLSQLAHWPQLPSVDSTTWSPTATLVTSGATASTSPAPSWPSTTGGGNMIVPFRTDTSLWQRPAASMRTRTSPARRSRTWMSDSTDAAVPSHTIALMVRTLPGG